MIVKRSAVWTAVLALASTVLFVSSPSGASGASLGSGKSTVKVPPSMSVDLNAQLEEGALVVSGLPGSSVRVVASVQEGTLSLTSTTGLTAPPGYPNTFSGPEIAFVGSTADVNAALAALHYHSSTTTGTHDITVSAAAADRAAVAYDPGNGHFYEYVPSTNVLWSTARTNALAASYLGMTGYLATVTSQQENDFITSKLGGAGAWIGGSDATDEATWRWSDGPEQGQLFWSATCGRGQKGICAATGMFNYWNSAEPNNTAGREHYTQILAGGTGEWNDLADQAPLSGRYQVLGYVVEYSTTSGAPNPALSVSRTISAVVGNFHRPEILEATPGECTAALSWSHPATTHPVVGYDVEYRDITQAKWTVWPHTTTRSNATISGLSTGTWEFRVATVDQYGRNAWGDPAQATVPCSQPGPAPGPTPRPETVIEPTAHKGRTVSAGRTTPLVRAVTDGRFRKVAVTCSLRGNALSHRLSDRLCATAVTLTRNNKRVLVTAHPTCSAGLRITVDLVAKRAGEAKAQWRRTWGVRSTPRIVCRIRGTG